MIYSIFNSTDYYYMSDYFRDTYTLSFKKLKYKNYDYLEVESNCIIKNIYLYFNKEQKKAVFVIFFANI